MSKYDFSIDLSPDTSTGAILSQIQPKSVVLEFGCAEGRMTRYMQQELGCSVYIVEYNAEAFAVAKAFAQDGLCDDIMHFGWLEKFGHIAFDAIIFADVLEHLTAPEKVLAEAGKLLKDTGVIYVSVPNITHNDILLKAYDGRFDYTSVGLLDDTHVHFWGRHNIEMLAQESGLHLRSLSGTHCHTGGTEQNVQTGKHQLFENLLRQTPWGEIYQFVFALDKGTTGETTCYFAPQKIWGNLYFDLGDGFGKDPAVAVDAVYTGNGSYRMNTTIQNSQNLRAIRLNPTVGQGCILQNISISQGEEKTDVIAPDGICLEDGLWLPGTEPEISADVLPEAGDIALAYEIILPGPRYLQMLEQAYKNKHIQMGGLLHQNEDLRKDLSAYIELTNQKELQIIALERQLAEGRVIASLRQNKLVRKLYNRVTGLLRKLKRYMKRRLEKKENLHD